MNKQVIPKATLEALGYKVNSNLWIGSGWMFCNNCYHYNYHFAMSREKHPAEIVVCKVCNSYSGNREIRDEQQNASNEGQ